MIRALVFPVVKFVGATILVVMAFNALVGEDDARSLGVTTAVVGGQSTDIVVTDMIPAFVDEISSDDETTQDKATRLAKEAKVAADKAKAEKK